MLVRERERKRENGEMKKSQEINTIFQKYKNFTQKKKRDPVIA